MLMYILLTVFLIAFSIIIFKLDIFVDNVALKINLWRRRRVKKYSDIMNVYEELEKYIAICKEKSACKFCGDKKKKMCLVCQISNIDNNAYSAWRTYIENKLSKVKTPEHIINFKHYIMDIKRTSIHLSSCLTSLILPLMTIAINQCIKEGVSDDFSEYIKLLSIIMIIVSVSYCISNEKIKNGKENNFYEDLIEIINDKLKNKEKM